MCCPCAHQHDVGPDDLGNPRRAIPRRLPLVLAAVAVIVLWAPATSAVTAQPCNGRVALCDRALGAVAFATTHNSMASEANHFRGPNQTRSIPEQLRHGIRGMQLDVYPGTAKGGSVYTDFSGPNGSLASDLPPSLVAAGLAAHRRLGAPPPGTPTDVYMCHGFCELGAIRFSTVARQIHRFLEANPRTVLIIVFEDHLAPERIADELRTSGLAPMLLPVEVGQPLPTLGAMIASGLRVLATLENGDGGATLRNAFAGLVEETPFTFVLPSALRAATSCSANRGDDSAPVFQFNHWLTPPHRATARVVNAKSFLRARVEQCEAARSRGPTLVAVDFAELGGLLSVVDDLNGQ
jgi:hypothetical protein